MYLPFSKALLLSPHVDDVEHGMGGTLSRMLYEGIECVVVAFSVGNSEDGSSSLEFQHSMEVFPDVQSQLYPYPTREFWEYRQAILDDLIGMRARYDPDVVFVPCTGQVHQDHQVITREAIRAFRDRTILGYESPWNEVNDSFRRHLFVNITGHEDVKADALACYESQIINRPVKADPDLPSHLAIVRGMQAGFDYAEAFEVIRWVI
jgi:LmbE family N-acetylglucosaminyl deacetylase